MWIVYDVGALEIVKRLGTFDTYEAATNAAREYSKTHGACQVRKDDGKGAH